MYYVAGFRSPSTAVILDVTMPSLSVCRTVALRVSGAVVLATLLVLPGSLHSQSVSDHIVAGDAESDANRLEQALRHYESAIAADSSAYDALWKASLAAVTLGEFDPDTQDRDSLFVRAVRYGPVCASTEAAAQAARFPAPDAEQSFGPNRLSISLGYLGVSMSYSTQRTSRVALGLAVGGLAQQGFMFPAGEVTGQGSVPWFAELLSGAAFLRHQVGSRVEIEGGPRVAWFYHFPSEYETIFAGVSADLRYRVGKVRVGPRMYWGRIAEEAGRRQTVFALVPLLVTFRWSW